ncbi:MAG TPA: SMP-30/gluconolactonase/LRE family protein [Kofleriaceae bacterium]|nr:SMP-30/gluconolactonase/LRE family protein [Kofleriaceae bacterium]
MIASRLARIGALVGIVLGDGAARADVLDLDGLPAELRAPAADVARVWKDRPDDPSVLYQVAALYARAGRARDAMRVLERMERTGAGLNPRPRDGFASLAGDPAFESLLRRIRRRHPPVLRARVAHRLAESDLVSEGIAWSQRTGELYLGSAKRKIVAVAPDGRVRDLVRPGAGGLGGLVGLRVDDARGELWAVSEEIDQPLPGAVIGLFRFHIPDGKLVRAYPVEQGKRWLLNDLEVGPDGSVYVTASDSGALLRVDRDSGAVEELLPAGSLPDPNGVALSADRRALYVAGWYTVTRVDLATRERTMLAKPRGVADGCFDGLYVHRGDLIGVQNCVHQPGRVVRLHLACDGRRILRATVLESSNPLFDGVTTGAVAGDRFYFAANSQFRKVKTGEPFDPVTILVLSLR